MKQPDWNVRIDNHHGELVNPHSSETAARADYKEACRKVDEGEYYSAALEFQGSTLETYEAD